MPAEIEKSRRNPDFLVIGAMKCGTTTLYHDLVAQPSIFLPDKESNLLLGENGPGKFRDAGAGRATGEVCPDYAKRPGIEGVAKRLPLDSAPKIIYLVRHPVERMISHHHFISSQLPPQNPGMSDDIDLAIKEFPELIDYGRYGFQLEPWVERFGRRAILVIRFEDYVTDRVGTLEGLFEFIGVPFLPELVREGEVHNRSAARPVLSPIWKSIRENAGYRKLVRPLTSLAFRNRVRQLILPRAEDRPAPPNRETIERVTGVYREDLEHLRGLLGEESPLWKL